MRVRPEPRASRRGLTLLETTVGLMIFTVVGYALTLAVGMGSSSQSEVLRVADDGRELRESSRELLDELRGTNEDGITVAVLDDGNHSLTLQQAIDDDGAMAWGVYEFSLGDTEEERTKSGWSVRYTVVEAQQAGAVQRQLVRQLLDEEGSVQKQSVLVRGLKDGESDPPGFQVEDVGAVWEVTLTVVGETQSAIGESMVLHVDTLN